METQIKNDPANNDFMQDLYARFAKEDVNTFRESCMAIIDQLHGKKDKRESFKRDLGKIRNKNAMVTKVTNFILAGQGLAVI